MPRDLNIFNFSDYRRYLNDWLKASREEKSFNLSKLAVVALIHPTFLSHVLNGDKHLSLEQAALMSDHFRHTKLEQDYFFILIHIDRAGSKRLKEYWLEKKSQLENEKNKLSKRFEPHHEITQEQRAQYYSSWIYAAIWLSTSIDDKQSLTSIANRFAIPRDKAEEVLSFLTEIGMCTEKNGFFSMGESHVHVTNDSPFVVKHHINWRMKAIQKMDTRKESELFFTGPMSMSREDFNVIREKLNKLIKESVDIAKESKAEDVVCLNIDFFQGPK